MSNQVLEAGIFWHTCSNTGYNRLFILINDIFHNKSQLGLNVV